MLIVRNQPQKDRDSMIHLHEIPGIVKFIESRMGLPGVRQKGNGDLLFNGYRVSLWYDKKSSEDEWWWLLHNSVNVLKPHGFTMW